MATGECINRNHERRQRADVIKRTRRTQNKGNISFGLEGYHVLPFFASGNGFSVHGKNRHHLAGPI